MRARMFFVVLLCAAGWGSGSPAAGLEPLVVPSEPPALRLKMIDSLGAPRGLEQGSGPLAVALRAVALLTGVAILAILGSSFAARLLRTRRQARENRFRERWQTILFARMAGDAKPLPALPSDERLLFLMLLLETLGYVRDDAADALTDVARELQLAPFVLRLLHGSSEWKRLVAIRSAAALQLPGAAEPLQRLIAGKNVRLSFEAAAALLCIDSKRGLDALAPLLQRLYWAPAAVASILKRCGAPAGPMMRALLLAPPPGGVKQVVRLIELVGDTDQLPNLRELLGGASDPETLAAVLHALRAFGGETDRKAAIALLAHNDWIVRMQAAYAVGGLGTREDVPALRSLLHDPSWWVRYRSAQSIVRLAGAAAVSAAAEREPDRYARDMLLRAVAEGA